MWLSLIPLAFLAAHVPSNATSGPWTAELNGTWLWHAGDDMRWASPSFDDSNWIKLAVPGPPPNMLRYWIRIPVLLGQVSDPGVMIGPVAYAYELYWDGVRLGNLGKGPPHARWFAVRQIVFKAPIHLAAPGRHVIAV